MCDILEDLILGSRFLSKNRISIKFGKKIAINKNLEYMGTGIGTHRIDTGDAYPVATSQYRLGVMHDAVVKQQVEEWLKEGKIRPCKFSEWRSPVIVVPKDGGKGYRVPIDYRRINAITRLDKYYMPNCDEIFDCLHGARYFSKLDAKSGFLQVDMHLDDIHKTAFATKDGVFEFLKMPFGLVNAPATFQRIMDGLLKEYKWRFVVIYIDDILIYSKSKEEHKEHLSKVLKV